MARGRQQKWICLDCKKEFSVQGEAPRLCCSCGSRNLGRAPSFDLAISFEAKKQELESMTDELNESYRRFTELKRRYDANMSYWAQQRKRGYITKDEYNDLASRFDGARCDTKDKGE